MISSPEKQFLKRIQNNQHNLVCQQPNLKLTECLCFQVDLDKIISNSSCQEILKKKKRKRKSNTHWEKFNCGSKNRITTFDLSLVTCRHCRKSPDFLALEKISIHN